MIKELQRYEFENKMMIDEEMHLFNSENTNNVAEPATIDESTSDIFDVMMRLVQMFTKFTKVTHNKRSDIPCLAVVRLSDGIIMAQSNHISDELKSNSRKVSREYKTLEIGDIRVLGNSNIFHDDFGQVKWYTQLVSQQDPPQQHHMIPQKVNFHLNEQADGANKNKHFMTNSKLHHKSNGLSSPVSKPKHSLPQHKYAILVATCLPRRMVRLIFRDASYATFKTLLIPPHIKVRKRQQDLFNHIQGKTMMLNSQDNDVINQKDFETIMKEKYYYQNDQICFINSKYYYQFDIFYQKWFKFIIFIFTYYYMKVCYLSLTRNRKYYFFGPKQKTNKNLNYYYKSLFLNPSYPEDSSQRSSKFSSSLIFNDDNKSLSQRLLFITNSFNDWNGHPFFYPLSPSLHSMNKETVSPAPLRRQKTSSFSTSAPSFDEGLSSSFVNHMDENDGVSSSAFKSYATMLESTQQVPSSTTQQQQYQQEQQIRVISPYVSLSKRLWSFHQNPPKLRENLPKKKEFCQVATSPVKTWRNGQCVNKYSTNSDAASSNLEGDTSFNGSISGSFKETPASSLTARTMRSNSTSAAGGGSFRESSSVGLSMMSTSEFGVLSPTSTLSPSTTKRLFIDEDTPKLINTTSEKEEEDNEDDDDDDDDGDMVHLHSSSQQPHIRSPKVEKKKHHDIVYPSVEQSLFNLSESMKSEVALSPEFGLREYRSPLRRAAPSSSPSFKTSSTAVSSPPSLIGNYQLEDSLLDVTNDWSRNTEAKTQQLQQAQAARELESEKEFRRLEAVSAEACRLAEEKLLAEAKQALLLKEKEEKDKAEALLKVQEEERMRKEQELLNNKVAQIHHEQAQNNSPLAAATVVGASTSPPVSPPPSTSVEKTASMKTDEFLNQWRSLKVEAEACQSTWLKSVNKRAKYINLVSSNNILNNSQSLMGNLPSNIDLKYFDFWLISTTVKKVSTLTNHEADDFLKFAGLLCCCFEMRPSLRPLAIGCLADSFSSSETADGGSLLAPSPSFPTQKLPPLHEQGYIELCSLQMCLMAPLRGAIVAALRNDNNFQQPADAWLSEDGVNVLVWLKKLTELSKQSIADNLLNNNQILMLGDLVLEPCLRVCGPVLWRCYGNLFEELLVDIRKHILRPLDDVLTSQRRKDMKPQIRSRVDVFLNLMTSSNYPPLQPPPTGVGYVPLFLDFQEEVSGSQKQVLSILQIILSADLLSTPQERSKKRAWLYNWANQQLHLNIRGFPGDIGPDPG